MTNENHQEREMNDREIALTNLKHKNFMDLAGAYIINRHEDYGKSVQSAVHDFKYNPVIHDSEFINSEFVKSGDEGKRYSENISGEGLMKKGMAIMNNSLNEITVKDLFELMGLKGKISEKYDQYNGVHLKELEKSESKEDQEMYKNLIGIYQSYFADKKASEALNARANTGAKIVAEGGLEEMLKGGSQ